MSITDELAALEIDSIEHARDLISPIRAKYLALVREQNVREQWSETLFIARQQSVNDSCDRCFQLTVVRLHPRGSICVRPLNLLSVAERAGL